MEVTGIKGRKVDISSLIAKLIYATWAFFRVRMYKRGFFISVLDRTPKMMSSKGGIVEIFDKVTTTQYNTTYSMTSIRCCCGDSLCAIQIYNDQISDFFLFSTLALIWMDILKVTPGKGLSSIFALGGAGTLSLTLASQDLAKRALNGNQSCHHSVVIIAIAILVLANIFTLNINVNCALSRFQQLLRTCSVRFG